MIIRLSALAGTAALFLGPAAYAQAPAGAPQPTRPAASVETAAGEAPAPGSNVEVFDPAYFTRFNPANAEEMVRQLPGFSLSEGQSVRGFGGATPNVLINGERPSTKTSLRTLLSRIPVANVLRIEIVTGASATLDMRGLTKVANVIVKGGVVDTSVSWQANARAYRQGRITGSVEASTTRQAFGGQLTLSVDVDHGGGFGGGGSSSGGPPGGGVRSTGDRTYFSPSMVKTEEGDGISFNVRNSISPSFDFRRKLDWGTLRLNGSLDDADYEGWRFLQVYTPNFSGALSRLEGQTSGGESFNYDLGGDVEFPFLGGLTKLIVLHERSEGSGDSLFGFYTGTGALTRSTRVLNETARGETILRGQTNWKLNDAHTIEAGIEGAYNFLDSTAQVLLNTGADVTPPGSDTIVEELRGEAQISDIWQVAPDLTLEAGLKVEFSRIQQEARLSPTSSLFAEREFTYPKPSFTATWQANESQQLRLSLARTVAQLDFRDFVSAVEVVNDTVTGGNADLEPEKVWGLSAEFEQKFWTNGVVTLTASYDKVEDVQDQVPVIPLGGSLTTAYDGPGNLGDGEKWSVGMKAAVPLTRIGIKGGRLDIDIRSGNSEVVDPVTGVIREFSDEFNRRWTLAFRQDVQDLGFSYGVNMGGSGGGTSYKLKELSKRQREGEELSVFVETRRFYGLNLRATYSDILSPSFVNNRVLYNGPRSTGTVTQYQRQFSQTGPNLQVRLSGVF
ncbi:MAG: outer membrane beta-barrel protein [Alphaproteobacteria bacterium]|nr:outer membrane beta-barrel protein [Alphaproteobacteria bacterium]